MFELMKTPADISFEELAAAAEKASQKADSEARKAGLKVAGRNPPDFQLPRRTKKSETNAA
jgi:hypothetical protein